MTIIVNKSANHAYWVAYSDNAFHIGDTSPGLVTETGQVNVFSYPSKDGQIGKIKENIKSIETITLSTDELNSGVPEADLVKGKISDRIGFYTYKNVLYEVVDIDNIVEHKLSASVVTEVTRI